MIVVVENSKVSSFVICLFNLVFSMQRRNKDVCGLKEKKLTLLELLLLVFLQILIITRMDAEREKTALIHPLSKIEGK